MIRWRSTCVLSTFYLPIVGVTASIKVSNDVEALDARDFFGFKLSLWLRWRLRLLYCHVHTNVNTKLLLRIWPIQVGTCWTHMHMHTVTLMETDAIHWSGGQPITAPREHGIRCLAQRHLSRGKEVALPPLQLSVHQSILRGESGNRPSRYWTTHSNHWATAGCKQCVSSKQ